MYRPAVGGAARTIFGSSEDFPPGHFMNGVSVSRDVMSANTADVCEVGVGMRQY